MLERQDSPWYPSLRLSDRRVAGIGMMSSSGCRRKFDASLLCNNPNGRSQAPPAKVSSPPP
jgi:hypothetical protein